MKTTIDLVGQKFGHLTVIKYFGKTKSRKILWECKCDCGNPNTTIVTGSNLKTGNTISCGCIRKQRLLNSVTKHNERHTKLYGVWCSMKSRCQNPNNASYKNYGGRGICVCEEWQNYTNFMQWSKESGYKENLSIDRIDVNGNYEPFNCRWVDMKTQANNTRQNKYVLYNNKNLTVTQWEEETKNPVGQRLKQGLSVEQAITLPVHYNYHYVWYNNKKYTLPELSEILKINYMKLYRLYIKNNGDIKSFIDNIINNLE